MADEMLKVLADNYQQAQDAIKKMEEYIKLAKEVGEQTATYEANLATAKAKSAKWYNALKARGYLK